VNINYHRAYLPVTGVALPPALRSRLTLSQTSEYALRTALYLAEHPGQAPARVGHLAGALRIPQNYLSKTLHQLARAGVLASTRGKHGGFRLARAPEVLTLHEIVAPFERFDQRRQCVLGRASCSDQSPCAAHDRWKQVSEVTAAFFQHTTLQDLIRTPRQERRGLSPRRLPVD
jgi:Rrf2 family protein